MNTELDLATRLVIEDVAALDEQRWDDWLEMHADDCEYWVPCWLDNHALNDDPDTGMSHIYYRTRAGLEDRVWRIRSRRSPASMPMPRTTHLVSNIQAQRLPDGALEVRANWVNHVFDLRHQRELAFYGRYQHVATTSGNGAVYKKKKIILLNDYITTYFDIYHV